MVGKNQRTVFRKKRKKFFTGVREDLPRCEATAVSELDTFAPCSPDKINGNYSLEETENSGFHANLHLSVVIQLPCHSNKIVDSTLFQECISEVVISSKGKSSKIRLLLWQDDNQRSGLDE